MKLEATRESGGAPGRAKGAKLANGAVGAHKKHTDASKKCTRSLSITARYGPGVAPPIAHTLEGAVVNQPHALSAVSYTHLRWSVTEHFFKICVEEMARFAIKVVKEGRQPEVRPYKWAEFLPGGARANELGPVARNGLTVGGGVGVRLTP